MTLFSEFLVGKKKKKKKKDYVSLGIVPFLLNFGMNFVSLDHILQRRTLTACRMSEGARSPRARRWRPMQPDADGTEPSDRSARATEGLTQAQLAHLAFLRHPLRNKGSLQD